MRCSRGVPVWKLQVDEAQRRKVDRYINATRSPMLFGPRVMLVEGIAEALLLPSLARRFLDAGQQAQFRGVALVAIDGVDFEPYARLLLSPHDGICIAERVVVVTDADPGAPGDRVAMLTNLAAALGAADRLMVASADITLEASLFSSGNVDCLRAGFLAQRPQSQHVWEEVMALPEVDQAQVLMRMFQGKRVSKGELAQHLAAVIDSGQPFTMPPYLEAALLAVVA